jgi:hypothetical protein
MTDPRPIEGMLAADSQARRRLSLDEVLATGLPAIYQRHGDRVLYLDGRIFDASDPKELAEILPIAPGAAASAVGLEFGWRHVGDCGCDFCSGGAAAEAR